jgi:hypothetical protein
MVVITVAVITEEIGKAPVVLYFTGVEKLSIQSIQLGIYVGGTLILPRRFYLALFLGAIK